MATLIRVLFSKHLHNSINDYNNHLSRRLDDQDYTVHDLVVKGSVKDGFIAIGVMAVFSFVSTLALLVFLTYRFIYWKVYYKTPLVRNQYIILIYNLLLADLQQAIGFLICLHWAAQGKATYRSAACILQGWWVQVSDPGSGLFVLAIALHTSLAVLRGRQLSFKVFAGCIIALWAFLIIVGIIPIALYHRGAFVVSEAGWCWMSREYVDARLWCHYIWIFISEFGTVTLYAVMFFFLRRKMAQAKILHHNKTESLKRLNRVVIYMVIYPVVYVVLSLPLAAGRMASEGNVFPSLKYFAVAGSLMAFSGFMDVLVYTLTRRHLLLETDYSVTDPHSAHNVTDSNLYQTHISVTAGKGVGNGGNGKKNLTVTSRIRRGLQQHYPRDSSNSTEDIVRVGDTELSDIQYYGVYQETTIEITHEPVEPVESSSHSTPTRSSH